MQLTGASVAPERGTRPQLMLVLDGHADNKETLVEIELSKDVRARMLSSIKRFYGGPLRLK